MSIQKVLYRAGATATGGRNGRSVSDDGKLDVHLVRPRELGGVGGEGTNPEQLFAAGYSACFLSAMQFVAKRDKLSIPADASVHGAVGIGPIAAGFSIEVDMEIRRPGLDRAAAETLVERAHMRARIPTRPATTSTYA
jgi:Ohr subfamily peroxiredoxin